MWPRSNLLPIRLPHVWALSRKGAEIAKYISRTGLNSGTSRVNDTFKASVARSVSIDGTIAVPENGNVTGRVTSVQPAQNNSRSGMIGVEFNQLSISGRTYAIDGMLTSLRADERKQIIEQEGQVSGKSSTSRTILFIGGGAGVGAAIGAIAGG